MPTAGRRVLTLDSVDAGLADARHLLVTGYTRVGNWSLGQVCWHLSRWIEYPLDGFPPLPVPLRPVAWVIRHTVAPAYLRRVLAGGGVPEKLPTPFGTRPPAAVDDLDGVTRYEAQLNRLRDFRGVPHESPVFGPMSADELIRLSCRHAAHHLSFLTPADWQPDPIA